MTHKCDFSCNHDSTHPAMNAAGPDPIPAGIYYSKLLDNFYDMESECGKGADFHGKWYDRRAEFPDESSGSGSAPVGQGSAAQYGTCDGNGIVGSPPDQYFDCPECAAMRDCPDCEGSGRISPAELCQRCNESGILPDQGSATSGESAINAACRKVADLLTEGKDITAAMAEYRAALAASAEQSDDDKTVAIFPPELPKFMPDFPYASHKDVWDHGVLTGWRVAHFAAPVAERAAAPARDSINEMRIALTVQLNSLIDFGDRYARRMRDLDPDESAYAQGAIDHARNVASPYGYNGPYRSAPASVSKPAALEVAEQAMQALRHMQGLAALPDGRNPRDVLLTYIQLTSASAPEVAQPAAQAS